MRLLLVLFGMLLYLQAADVSGRWAGTSEFVNRGGEVRSGPVMMTFKQSGEALEGTAGPSAERQQEIRNGKVVGDKVTFEIQDAAGRGVVELVADGETLTGEAKLHREYGVIPMKLKLKRE